MSIPPVVVNAARSSWHWQWRQLMNGLGPSDKGGNYIRPKSQHEKASLPNAESIQNRSSKQLPSLIIGRSCPWAHRTWLVYKLKNLENKLNLIIATADHKAGRWGIDPPWLGYDSLLELYK